MYHAFFKRFIDCISSILLLILLFIPFLIIAMVIGLDSRGGIFYKQVRVGKEGEHFKIYKFRTMVANADKIGSYSTAQNDSRITKIGSFLRRTSLDELPQLINVFLGQMSLIGPRPDVPQQRELYTENEFIERHKVKPGITGLSQCLNRHHATLDERKKNDIFYANNLSFLLDVRIVLLTIQTVLKGSY